MTSYYLVFENTVARKGKTNTVQQRHELTGPLRSRNKHPTVCARTKPFHKLVHTLCTS